MRRNLTTLTTSLLMALATLTPALTTTPAFAQEAESVVGVVYEAPEHVFSIADLQGGFDGLMVDLDGGDDVNNVICLTGDCPGEEQFTDKEGDTLYPIDSEFGFEVTDFYEADQRVDDDIYEEGWAGNIVGEAGEVIGIKVSNMQTEEMKAGNPVGTWCAGLGGNSVKCSTEHLVTMEHALTCAQTVPYAYYDDVDGTALPEAGVDCETLSLDGFTAFASDGTPTSGLTLTEVLQDATTGEPILEPNESSVIADIAVGEDFSVTVKDDGKPLFRFGTMVKRPIDVRMYARIPLPDEWKLRDEATGELVNDFKVLKAELVVEHEITNNPNDQLRPEDYENEAAIGRLPGVTGFGTDTWQSDQDCYEGDGHYIPAGTTLRDGSVDTGGDFSSDLRYGFTNAWYTTIDRDPFEWSYTGGSAQAPVPDGSLGDLISGPRWRLLSNKFGQDIPGLEIPLRECSAPPYQHDTIRYEVGEPATTVRNLLDWATTDPLTGDPLLDEMGEPIESPMAMSSGWVEPGFDVDDPTLPRCEPDAVTGECISVNGLPLTEDFDLAVYVKGDQKPASIFSAQLVIVYEGGDIVLTDFGDAPEGDYGTETEPLSYAYPTLFDVAEDGTVLADGARHVLTKDSTGAPLLALGETVDVELNGQPTVAADGDDLAGTDDEDGVVFATALVPGTEAKLDVTTALSGEFTDPGYFHGWIDFNADGDWDDLGEYLGFLDSDGNPVTALAAGTQTIKFAVPLGVGELDPDTGVVPYPTMAGETFARFRFSSSDMLEPGGEAPDGEVEDYLIEIVAADFDDIIGLAGDDSFQMAMSTGVSFNMDSRATFGPDFVDYRIGDFNGDGFDDVAARNVGTVQSPGQWSVALTTYNEATDVYDFDIAKWGGGFPIDTTWLDVVVGDFNADGLDDLAGRNAENGTWHVATSDGSAFDDSGTLDTWVTDVTWVDVQTGDFNGDAGADIIGRQLETGDWFVTTESGPFGNWPAALKKKTIPWVNVHAADFNGDGLTDMVGRNGGTGNWFVSLNDAGVRLGDGIKWGKEKAADIVVFGDFDANAMEDAAVYSAQTGQWKVGLSDGASFSFSTFGKWNKKLGYVDVVVGDFNADGRDDIAGRSPSDGMWNVALSTGSTFTMEKWGKWDAGNTYEHVGVGEFGDPAVGGDTGE